MADEVSRSHESATGRLADFTIGLAGRPIAHLEFWDARSRRGRRGGMLSKQVFFFLFGALDLSELFTWPDLQFVQDLPVWFTAT